jgi:hypothetical protein
MKISTRLAVLGLCLVNGMATGYADVIIDGQHIQAADISNITIDPVTGDISVSAGGLYDVTPSGDTDPNAGPSVVINSFTVNDTTILEGGSVTLSWNTTDADACTPSLGGGGWGNKVITLPGGSTSVTLNTAASYTFRLDCSNDTPSSTFRTVTVSVDSPIVDPGPTSCPTPTLSGSTTQWQSHFGQSWPSPNYAEVVTAIPRAGYLAIQFNTGSVVEDGGVASIQHTSTHGERLGAISECPGDFSQRLPDTLSNCTELWYIGGGIKWNTLAGDQSGQCDLEANTTYYLNLTFTDGVSPNTDRCVSTLGCKTTIRVWK